MTNTTQESKNKKTRLAEAVRDAVALVFWVYVFTKIFLYDIDVWFLSHFFPEFSWVLQYKFFLIIGVVAVIWLHTKNKQILLWTLYILFYPVILFFWRIPYKIFKQKSWVLAFAIINAVISFVASVKYTFITLAIFLVTSVGIVLTSNTALLWIEMGCLVVVLMIIYVHRLLAVFRPSAVLDVHKRLFTRVKDYALKQFRLDDDIKNIPVAQLNDEQKQKWSMNLQLFVVFNRLCLFGSRQLKNYHSSGISTISQVLVIAGLIVITCISFASVNLGVYKLSPNSFDISTNASYFSFVYYSFNTLLFNSISEFTPLGTFAKAISMLEQFSALFLVVILVSLILSIRSQRLTEELSESIEKIEHQGAVVESVIRREFKIASVEEAIMELERVGAVMLNFIYKISATLK